MGRSGGGGRGFSGGGRSGGFSGGGRRSGGFSGGGGRSGGRSGGPAGGPPPMGGFARPRPHVHVHVPLFGGFMRPGPMVGAPAPAGGGCAGGLLALVLAVLLIVALGSSLSLCSALTGGPGSTQAVEASATVREKLPSDAVTPTDYYTDADGDWVHSASRLTEGLEEFYDRTGVQPYVYILPNGETTSTEELAARAEELYPQLFSDEGHLLLVFCDAGDGTFNCGYTVGTAASAVMDSEALDVLADELSYAYDNASTDEGVFSDAFSRTAERIMSASEGEQARERAVPIVVGAAVAVVVAGGAVYLVRRRRAAEAEEKRRMEDILSTPLEKFGDKEVEDLADKYEDRD